MMGRKGAHVSSSVGSHCFCSSPVFNCSVGYKTLGNNGDKLLTSLADEGTEAQREEVTCLLTGQWKSCSTTSRLVHHKPWVTKC